MLYWRFPMRPCPVCLKPADFAVGELAVTFTAGPQTRSKYDLIHCKPCDVVYLSPLPLPQDLDAIYSAPQFDYYTEEQTPAVMEFYTGRIGALHEHLGNPEQLNVLEIGAGPAWIARAAKEALPFTTTVAQDVSPEMAARCPWVDRYLVQPAESNEIDALGPYDVISLTHVIEHLPDPLAMLRRLRPITRGVVFITAPHRPERWNGSIEQWRSYSYNHVPAHLQYYSHYGMRRAAEVTGFKVAFFSANSENGQSFEAWLE